MGVGASRNGVPVETGRQASMGTGWALAPVETECRLSMGARCAWAAGETWAPDEHAHRVSMSASRNASAVRNAGWRRVRLWISPFPDGLFGAISSGCCGGYPNRPFEIAAVNRKASRHASRCSGGRGGLKVDVECVRCSSGPIAFLRLLSHLFKVRSIRFPHGAFHRTFKCNQVASLARGF